MNAVEEVLVSHYTKEGLLQQIKGGLAQLGADPEHPKPEDLKPVDEFHTGGAEATDALLSKLDINQDTRVLDIGSGIGGTARVIATRYAARVTGVDLTPAFVETATELSRMTGIGARTDFIVGSATNLPLGEGAFDLALLLHVGMNISDKLSLFREARRVLAPHGVFAVYDVMRGENGAAKQFPVPWSSERSTSFVDRPDVYRDVATAAGFALISERDRTDFARGFFEKTAAANKERGGPAPLGIHLLMGEAASLKIENYLAMLNDGRIRPVEMIFRVKG
jgi:SAM-dependent methyltransferase